MQIVFNYQQFVFAALALFCISFLTFINATHPHMTVALYACHFGHKNYSVYLHSITPETLTKDKKKPEITQIFTHL